MKTGIVLEGGAMRGLFTAGVLDVLMENHIGFDAAVGVSAGAAFGCNLKSKQIGRVVRYNTRFAKDWRYCSFRSLLTTGDLYGAKFCYETMPYELDIFDTKTFEENSMPFYCVCTNVRTGEAVYHDMKTGYGDDMLWLRASASMPLASTPVEIGGEKYLDGGIVDSIPLPFMEGLGMDRIVVVLTQPITYRKTPSAFIRAMKPALMRYPSVYEALAKRHDAYNAQVEYVLKREGEGKAFVIRPPMSLGIGDIEHDARELKRVYEIGKNEMTHRLAALTEYLNK